MNDTPGRLYWADDVLRDLDRTLENEPAESIIGWAVDTFGRHLCLTASMTDAVLIDLASSIDANVDVVFIDTGFHFPETLETVEAVRRRYDLNLRIVSVRRAARSGRLLLRREGATARLRPGRLPRLDVRVEEVRRAQPGPGARRRTRPAGPDDEVRRYISAHDVPVNPLVTRGDPPIGCQPCTRPVVAGADPRSGRWPGRARTECGLHQ